MGITPAHVGVVLNKEDRQGHHHETEPCKQSLECGQRIGVGQNDQDHDDIAHSLNPSLESHKRIVGPEHANGTVAEEEQYRSILMQKRSDSSSPVGKDDYAEG